MSRIVVRIGLAILHRAATRCGALLITLSFFMMPGLAAADIVIDWNVILEQVAPRFGGPQQQSRVQAMVHIAIHDALNAIVPRYDRYAYLGAANPAASPDAAVAAAARQTLLGQLATLPDSALKTAAIATVENAYAATVGPAPHDAATQAGIDAGDAARRRSSPCGSLTGPPRRTFTTPFAPRQESSSPHQTRSFPQRSSRRSPGGRMSRRLS